jgi:hypothetical protein
MSREAKARVREHAGGGLSTAGNRLYLHSTAQAASRQEPRYGKLEGEVWRKTGSASRHMLWAPRAWAVDADDLACVEALGVRYVLIHDLEQMRQYWARPETLRAKGFVFERNAGEQVALTLDWWRPTAAQADLVAEGLREREPEPVARQGVLW